MTAARIALNTLSRIVRASEKYGFGGRVHYLTEKIIQELAIGARCYVVNLSLKEQTALTELGFSLKLILTEARGKKDLCEVTIR